MKKVIRLTESDLTRIVRRVIEEQTIINEQTQLLNIPFNRIQLTSGDNTKQIKLSATDPNTKKSYVLKYNISGEYGWLDFDVEMRNIKRLSSGELYVEVKPTNGFVHKTMKTLVPNENLTKDGWLINYIPKDKIDTAIAELKTNKGVKAEIDAGKGVTVSLTYSN